MIAPRLLFRLHGRIVMRMFDGRGFRRRDAVLLRCVRFTLDTCSRIERTIWTVTGWRP